MQQVCITRFFMQNRGAPWNLRKFWKFLWKICWKWLPSSALFGIIKKQNQFASLVKRWRRSPLKAESGVRFPYEVPSQCVDLSTDGSARFFYGRIEYLKWKRKAASAAFLFGVMSGWAYWLLMCWAIVQDLATSVIVEGFNFILKCAVFVDLVVDFCQLIGLSDSLCPTAIR